MNGRHRGGGASPAVCEGHRRCRRRCSPRQRASRLAEDAAGGLQQEQENDKKRDQTLHGKNITRNRCAFIPPGNWIGREE